MLQDIVPEILIHALADEGDFIASNNCGVVFLKWSVAGILMKSNGIQILSGDRTKARRSSLYLGATEDSIALFGNMNIFKFRQLRILFLYFLAFFKIFAIFTDA